MSKDTQYVMFQTLRKGKNNDGVCLQITPTNSGDMLFTMARQYAVENNLPKFDYQHSIKVGFSDLEAAKICLAIERQLMSGGYDDELKFPHMASKNPKNISMKFSQYNNKPQCTFGIYPQNDRGATIFLNEEEMYIIKTNLQAQINLHSKKNMIELLDTRKFKEYMAGGQN